MGELPPTWINCMMGDISKVIGGGTPKTSDNENFSTNDYAWITPADLSKYQKMYIYEGKRFLSPIGLSKSSAVLLPPGTVLFTSRAPIGYVAIAGRELSTNQGFKSFVCDSGILPEYIYFYLKTAKPIAEQLASGTTFLEISGANAAKIPLPLAPLNEQRRIVAKLEKLLAKVDTCKERLDKIPGILKRFRQSVLAAACSGRLTADWRKNNPDVEPASELLKRVKEERKKCYEEECTKAKAEGRKKPKKPANLEPEILFSDNGIDIPDTWIWTSFENVSSIKQYSMSSGPFGSALGTKDYRDRGVPVIRGQNVQDGLFIAKNFVYISEDKALELKRSTAYPRDIVIVAVGAGSGNAAIVPNNLPRSILSQNCNKFTLDDFFALPEFIILVLQIEISKAQMQEITTDTARQFLSLTNLKEMIFPIAPLEEQQEIVNRVQHLFKIADRIEQRYQKAKNHVDQLTQSILAKAFRGELVPQDPNDEPASVLLERIRTEREKREAEAKTTKKSTSKKGGRRTKKAEPQELEAIQLELPLSE